MYNKTKHTLNLTSAVLSIIIGCLELIGAIVSILAIMVLMAAVAEGGEDPSALTLLIALMTIDLAFGIVFIVVGALGCRKPVEVNGVWNYRNKINVTLLVLAAIIFVFGIVNFVLQSASVFMIISFILSIGVIVLEIVALCLKGNAPAQQTARQPEEQPETPPTAE